MNTDKINQYHADITTDLTFEEIAELIYMLHEDLKGNKHPIVKEWLK